MNQAVAEKEMSKGEESLVDEIIRLSDFTFDRLPMLDIIGARLVENLSAALPCPHSETRLFVKPQPRLLSELGLEQELELCLGLEQEL